MFEGGVLNIHLVKGMSGDMWQSPFKDHGFLHPYEVEMEKKRVLLERVQQAHPSFDFSNAQFNGNAPCARTFMGVGQEMMQLRG